MARSAGSHHAAFAQLLSQHGLGCAAAAEFADELLCRYPLVRRIGLEAAADHLAGSGLTADAARAAALELLAFELLGRLRFEEALVLLKEQVEPGAALGACLEAAKVRRAVRGRPPTPAPGRLRGRLLRLALNILR